MTKGSNSLAAYYADSLTPASLYLEKGIKAETKNFASIDPWLGKALTGVRLGEVMAKDISSFVEKVVLTSRCRRREQRLSPGPLH
jgi:hypothetical protein